MTKEDLLRRMESENACREATNWVKSFATGTPARDIWLACRRVDWMCWLAFRGRPKAAVAFCCAEADIAIRVHAVNALRSAGLNVEANKLASLPPVTAENARNAAYAARAAASAAYVARDPNTHSAAANAAYAHAASAAAYAADTAHAARSAYYAASAADAAYYAADAANAAYAANATADTAHADATYYATTVATSRAAYHATTTAADSSTRQVKALHALWDGKHGLEGWVR